LIIENSQYLRNPVFFKNRVSGFFQKTGFLVIPAKTGFLDRFSSGTLFKVVWNKRTGAIASEVKAHNRHHGSSSNFSGRTGH
jgi:hypothetical protein